MEKVTIGITCFNAADSIETAVRSALSQNWPDLEIVIVDDASTDDSWEVVQNIQKLSPSIRIYRNEKNLGVADARNVIIDMAQGEFLAFFDDDDISMPERIPRQIQAITDYERLHGPNIEVLCHTARKQTYPNGHRRIEKAMGEIKGAVAPHGLPMARNILYNNPIHGIKGSMATCSQMARLSVYRHHRFDENFRRNSDMELSVRIALSGGHFVGIQDALVEQTMTYGTDKQIAYERQYTTMIYKKHESFLRAERRGRFDLDWLEIKFLYLSGKTGKFATELLSIAAKHPVLTVKRLLYALPHVENNSVFRRFYRDLP